MKRCSLQRPRASQRTADRSRLDGGPVQRWSQAAAVTQSLEFGEISSRMVIVALFTFLAVRLGADFMQTGRLTGPAAAGERSARGRADGVPPAAGDRRSQRSARACLRRSR